MSTPNLPKPGGIPATQDVKRFYIKGLIVKAECPECAAECLVDIGDQYLSEPVSGDTTCVYFYCGECENEDRNSEFEREYRFRAWAWLEELE